MSVVALPPDLAVGARCEHLGRELAVELRVPLFCQQRFAGREVVEAGQHLPPRAVGTSAAVRRARSHHGLPLVTQRAAPPDSAV